MARNDTVIGEVGTATQKEFYRSGAWRRVRDAYIQTRLAVDGGMCEVCGEEPGKIVHHTVWLNDENCNDSSISLNPKLLKYECQTCHNQEKPLDKIAFGRCLFDADGNVIRNTEY